MQTLFLALGMQDELPEKIRTKVAEQLKAMDKNSKHLASPTTSRTPRTPKKAPGTPRTPKKTANGDLGKDMTPEKPRTLPRRVAASRAAAFGQAPEKDTKLRPAGRKSGSGQRTVDFDETPERPAKLGKKGVFLDKLGVVDDPMEEDSEENEAIDGKVRRKSHTRVVKKPEEASLSNQRAAACRYYLDKIGFDWPEFQRQHNRLCRAFFL